MRTLSMLLATAFCATLIPQPGGGRCLAATPDADSTAPAVDNTTALVDTAEAEPLLSHADQSLSSISGLDTLRRAPPVAEPHRPLPANKPPEIIVVTYHYAVREHDLFSQAVPQLLAYVKTATRISVPIAWSVRPLFAPQVQDALLLYMTGQDARMQLAPVEKMALGKYLRGGGLLFGDDIVSGGSPSLPPRGGGVTGTPFDRQFKALIADPLVLGLAGRHWQRMPLDHPLYHNYFDFPDGPPLAASYTGNVQTLEMLEYRGRLSVIFSDLNLSWFWATQDAQARERPLQLGVNVVVQALAYRYAGRPLPLRR